MMESISSNLPMPIQTDNQHLVNFNPVSAHGIAGHKFVNDVAAFVPNFIDSSSFKFDTLMNNFASFGDLISVAQGDLSQMKEQGERIQALVAQAQAEGVTPELMEQIQAEVDARVEEIGRIRNFANFNGVNPFQSKFSLDIPDVLSLMGANSKEEASNAISEMLGSFDIDINIEGDGFSFGGSAKIEIGYTEDGALQINVDASMDYDLSGLVNNGVGSDEAFDLINNFVSMLGVQQGDLGNAQNFLDALFNQIFNKMTGASSMPDGIEIESDSTNSLKGQIVQQASITLDGMANQAPNIAINIL